MLFVHAYIFTDLSIYIYTCLYMYIYIFIYAYVEVHTCVRCMYVCVYIYAYVPTPIWRSLFIASSICHCALCNYARMHAQTHTHTRIYI